MRVRQIRWLAALALAVAVAFPVLLAGRAHHVNGNNGFPLDDPWIHLCYARTLHETGHFAYFPGAPPAQGSTSPLYTLLLALGFGVTTNEKLLCYALGLGFHAAFLVLLGLWARRRLGGWGWAAAVVAVCGLDDGLGILSVSGMETSLFLALVTGAFCARAAGKPLWCAVAAGLCVWARPDGLVWLAALVLAEGANGRRRRRQPWRAWAPAAVLLAGYFAFNWFQGGAFLPNTFAAKAAYYSVNPRRMFFTLDLVPVFFAGGWLVLAPFAAVAAIRAGVAWTRQFAAADGRRTANPPPPDLRLEAAWAVALPLAYWLLLPYGHRFGRYLVPALPAYAILACAGLRSVAAWCRARWPARARTAVPAAGVVLGLAAGSLQLRAAAAAMRDYASLCQYHHARHERTGRWLGANTAAGAVIATHDVGAIGFYSRRKIVDIAGVIDPEVAKQLWQPGYIAFLQHTFAARQVTHIVTLREWMGVDNVAPLFTADPQPDWMEVYPWIPGQTHLLAPTVDTLLRTADSALRAGDVARARRLAETALRQDDESSRLWSLTGRIHEQQKDYPGAEAAYRRAIALFPEADDTRYRLAVVLVQQRQIEAARAELRTVVARKPGHAAAVDLLRRLQN